MSAVPLSAELFWSVEVRRPVAGAWVNGDFVRGTDAILSIKAHVEPASGKMLLSLPEAQRTKDSLAVLSVDELRTSDEAASIDADRLYIDGLLWLIVQVKKIRGPILPHFEAIAQRLEVTT